MSDFDFCGQDADLTAPDESTHSDTLIYLRDYLESQLNAIGGAPDWVLSAKDVSAMLLPALSMARLAVSTNKMHKIAVYGLLSLPFVKVLMEVAL